MAAVALVPGGLTLVSLGGGSQPADLSRMFPRLTMPVSHHVECRADTPAQRNVTASRIDGAVGGADRAVLLIAEGVGCAAAAWWARLSPRAYVERVAGALLIGPDGDVGSVRGFASPRAALPFPSLVVGSSDSAQRLSGEWGSRLIDGPALGARMPPSTRLQSIVGRFTSAIVEKDVRKANRLIAALGDG